MAIRHWHPGKLVLFWVICLISGMLAFGGWRAMTPSQNPQLTRSGYDQLYAAVEEFITEKRRGPTDEELDRIGQRLGIMRWQKPAALRGLYLLLGALTVALWTVPFVVSWTWFNAREQQTRGHQNHQNSNGTVREGGDR